MSQIAIDTSPSGGADFRARGPSFSSIYSILARSASSLVDALTLSHETNSASAGVVNSGSLASSREAMLQSESLKYAVPNEPCVPTFVKTCVNWIKEHDGQFGHPLFRKRTIFEWSPQLSGHINYNPRPLPVLSDHITCNPRPLPVLSDHMTYNPSKPPPPPPRSVII